MIYYTNVLGISDAIVGSLYFVIKLFDAFIDVGVRRLYDTSKLTAYGRFNPWVCRPVSVVCAGFLYTAKKMIYICCSYFIYGLLLSTVSIPYGAMSAAISSNSGRARITLNLAQYWVCNRLFYSYPDVYYSDGRELIDLWATFLLDLH